MDGANINKYLSQFNPILIVPVLSAVVGAILVFVFGFKRAHGPRFTSSGTDSLKKSKKKLNNTKQQEQTVQSSKVQNVQSAKLNSKKVATSENVNAIAKKATSNDKTSVKKKEEKKADERKSDTERSPAKKVNQTNNKKSPKESPVAAATAKKQKSNKKNVSNEGNVPKPADFDDGDWFTVQSKSTKNKNKPDDGNAKQIENASPKSQATKNQKQQKNNKTEKVALKAPEETNGNDAIEAEPVVVEAPAVVAEVAPEVKPLPVVGNGDVNGFDEVEVQVKEVVIEKPAEIVVAAVAAVAAPVEEVKQLAFDELGEWTDAKSDRKKNNKKKSRKE